MFSKQKDKFVFVPGKIPDLTYNRRDSEKLERQLQFELEVGGRIIILSGPSKIGKTVLINKVLPREQTVLLQGEELVHEEKLTIPLLRKLKDLPSEEKIIESIKENDQTNIDLSAEADARVSFWKIMGAKISTSFGKQLNQEQQVTKEQSYLDDPFNRAMDYMIQGNYILVIDDFHYINKDKQREIIRKLKTPLSKGLKIVFALIPSRTEIIVQREPDMDYRTTTIELPLWTPDELKYIPEKGFNSMNIELDQKMIDDLIQNSFANPLLMQDFCARILYVYELPLQREKSAPLLEINYDENKMNTLYKMIAKEDTAFKQLTIGRSGGSKRRTEYKLTLKNGHYKFFDIYGLILFVLGSLAYSDVVKLSELMAKIEDFHPESEGPTKKKPTQQAVTSTLKQMSKIASELNCNDPVLEYKETDHRIYMHDSFFSFNLSFNFIKNQEN